MEYLILIIFVSAAIIFLRSHKEAFLYRTGLYSQKKLDNDLSKHLKGVLEYTDIFYRESDPKKCFTKEVTIGIKAYYQLPFCWYYDKTMNAAIEKMKLLSFIIEKRQEIHGLEIKLDHLRGLSQKSEEIIMGVKIVKQPDESNKILTSDRLRDYTTTMLRLYLLCSDIGIELHKFSHQPKKYNKKKLLELLNQYINPPLEHCLKEIHDLQIKIEAHETKDVIIKASKKTHLVLVKG